MWIHVPLECSPSSVASPDSALASESLYQNLATFVSSRGNLLPAKYWQRAWPMDRLTRHPSLRILPSSTAGRGVDEWILSKGASHAKTCPLPENEPGSLEAGQGFGVSTSASLKKASLKRHSLKTSADYSQVALFSTDPTYWDTSTQFAAPRNRRNNVGTLKLTSNAFTGDFSKHTESRHCSMSSAAWERWVTKARRDFSRRQKSGPVTSENVFLSWRIAPAEGSGTSGEMQSGVWRSPNTRDHHAGGPRLHHPQRQVALVDQSAEWPTPSVPNGDRTSNTTSTRADGSKRQVDLGAIAPLWPTPRTITGGGESAERKQELGRTSSGGGDLQSSVDLWQTPATDSFRSRGGDRKDEMGLDQEARHWPTPNARDEKNPASPDGKRAQRKADLGYTVDLNDVAANWGTPTTRDWKDGSSSEADCPTNGLLGRQVIRMDGPAMWPTPDGGLYGNQPNANTKEWGGNNTLISFAEKGLQRSRNWPTPTANDDNKSPEAHLAMKKRMGERDGTNSNRTAITSLQVMVQTDCLSSPQAPEQATSGKTCWCGTQNCDLPSHRRRLNALFVTWMMNWPLFWLAPVPTKSGRQGMALYLFRQRSLLSRLLGKSASNKGATQ